ncbi:MAG: DUF4332 domain-containing protein [Candidatus Bathyarchaeia archaeon]
MRPDYILYVIGIALFGTAGYVLFDKTYFEDFMGGVLIYSAVVFVLFLFGITSFIFGYSNRPKKQKVSSIKLSPTAKSLMELTRVKGIGERRAEQLKALGIATVADLSVASAEELAEKLQVSLKITNLWITEARNLLLEK